LKHALIFLLINAKTPVASFLSTPSDFLLDQSLSVLVEAMSTSHPHNCPATVWITRRSAGSAAFVHGLANEMPLAYFLSTAQNALSHQALSLLVRAMSTTRPQDYPAWLWIVRPPTFMTMR
jgi:hypothetical protein